MSKKKKNSTLFSDTYQRCRLCILIMVQNTRASSKYLLNKFPTFVINNSEHFKNHINFNEN